MLDKQFTIISGSTCIVVLLMLLARTDAAPQVGEIDAMQETVTGAPSDSPIYSVYQVDYYSEDHDKKRFIECYFDVTSGECKLEVGKRKDCPIKLAEDQGSDCKELKQTTVNFNLTSPDTLEIGKLNINGVATFSSRTRTDSIKKYNDGKLASALIYKPSSFLSEYRQLHIYMNVLRE
eukprot:Nk52_evm1s599 gene=Nk52_evmTU1s599